MKKSILVWIVVWPLLFFGQYDMHKSTKVYFILKKDMLLTDQLYSDFLMEKFSLFPLQAQKHLEEITGQIHRDLDTLNILLHESEKLKKKYNALNTLMQSYLQMLVEKGYSPESVAGMKNKVFNKLIDFSGEMMLYVDFPEDFLQTSENMMSVNALVQEGLQNYVSSSFTAGNKQKEKGNSLSVLKQAGKKIKDLRNRYKKDSELSSLLRWMHQDVEMFYEGIKNNYHPKILAGTWIKFNRKILKVFLMIYKKYNYV